MLPVRQRHSWTLVIAILPWPGQAPETQILLLPSFLVLIASSSTPDALGMLVGSGAPRPPRESVWRPGKRALVRREPRILAQFHPSASSIYINYLFGKIEVAVILGRMEDNVHQVPGPQESSAATACSLRPPELHAQKEENQLSTCCRASFPAVPDAKHGGCWAS